VLVDVEAAVERHDAASMTLHDVHGAQYAADSKRREHEGVARERRLVRDVVAARRRQREENRRSWWISFRNRIGRRVPRLRPSLEAPALPWSSSGDLPSR
jgi:hypothetical protein